VGSSQITACCFSEIKPERSHFGRASVRSAKSLGLFAKYHRNTFNGRWAEYEETKEHQRGNGAKMEDSVASDQRPQDHIVGWRKISRKGTTAMAGARIARRSCWTMASQLRASRYGRGAGTAGFWPRSNVTQLSRQATAETKEEGDQAVQASPD